MVVVLLLLLEILNTIIREIISLIAPASRSAAISTVVLFSIMLAVLFFGPMCYIIYHMISHCKEKEKEKECLHVTTRTTFILLEASAAVFYFFGDNFNYIAQNYREELNCGPGCINNVRIATGVLLGVALIIFNIAPPVLHTLVDIFKKKDETFKDEWEEEEEEEQDVWYTTPRMVTSIVKIDTLYTVITIMVQTDEFCGIVDLSISITFFIIVFFLGTTAIIIYAIYSCVTIEDGTHYITASCALLVIGLPLYMLADNQQPIDCAFGCDTFAANTTRNELECDLRGNNAMRLVFMLVALGIFILAPLILFCGWKKKQTQVDVANN